MVFHPARSSVHSRSVSHRGGARGAVFRVLTALLVCCLAACGSYEEKRIRELMVEKGFGTRAQGDATVEEYVGGRDMIAFQLDPKAFLRPDAERLYYLTAAQPVALDGTIVVPYVGNVYVLGKTQQELTDMVRNLLLPVFNQNIDMEARIVSQKFFYAFGETGFKGPQPMRPDLTLFEALATIRWTNLANLGRVYLIRPDAEHPLVMEVNFRDMVFGDTMRNFRLRENDVVYIPPTFLGLVARILERALQPVALAVQTMLGLANVASAYDYLQGNTPYYYRF
jgi:hypothetical protein